MVAEGFRLDILLVISQLAPSTYYYQVKQLDKPDKDKELKAEIQAIYDEHKGNYGYRRIHLEEIQVLQGGCGQEISQSH